MTGQSLNDRWIGDVATWQSEIAVWSTRLNEKWRTVDGRFTNEEARDKLTQFYPKF